MINQSVGRNQKSEGFKIKHVLQITLLLVICIWSFYIIKNSNYKWIEKILKDGSVDLGRKGSVGSYDVGVLIPKIIYVDGETEENDELEDLEEKALDHEAKEDEKKPKETVKSEEGKPTQSSDGDEANENKPEHEEKDEENDSKDEEPKYNAERAESTSISGVNGFHDENGIPPGDNEIIATDETRIGSLQPMIMDEEGVLEFDYWTELVTNMTEAEEYDTSTQTYGQNDSEMPSGSYVLGKTNIESDDSGEASMVKSSTNITHVDTSPEGDFNSENADKLDKSSINENAELIEEENIVLEDSISDLSQDQVEEVEDAEFAKI